MSKLRHTNHFSEPINAVEVVLKLVFQLGPSQIGLAEPRHFCSHQHYFFIFTRRDGAWSHPRFC